MEFIELSPTSPNEIMEKVGIAERVICWNEYSENKLTQKSRFGFVLSGLAEIQFDNGVSCSLPEHSFFASNQGLKITGGKGFLIELQNSSPLHLIGGPIEKQGRLKYIDGCMDSLLLSPPKAGDPCLNALYFPKDITQTTHTHPTVRIGAVISGNGICNTPSGDHNLTPGMLFAIPPNALHRFITSESTMTIVAFHPDSDFGPHDDDHPMINRTIVDGTSAKKIQAIRTI